VNLPVPVVWSQDCLRHEPGSEVWLGVRDAGTEVPARALVLRGVLAAAGAPVVPAQPPGDDIPRAVHDPGLLGHLAGILVSSGARLAYALCRPPGPHAARPPMAAPAA
jgi:hypothetical protein